MRTNRILWISFVASFILYLIVLGFYIPRIAVSGTCLPKDISLSEVYLKNIATFLGHLFLPFLLPAFIMIDISQLEALTKLILPQFNFTMIIIFYIIEHILYNTAFSYGVLP